MYNKIRSVSVPIFIIISLLSACQNPVNPPVEDISIVFQDVVQTGGTSGSIDSTGLTLAFDVDPGLLTVLEINVTGATKGTLSGSGRTRNLTISDITVANGETVSVSISDYLGYSFIDSPKTAVVFKAPKEVTFSGLTQVDGISNSTNTTSLRLTFSQDPTGITADDITVTGATKGTLTGTGLTRSFAISYITVANGESVSVSISDYLGYTFTDSTKTAVVFKAGDTVNPPVEYISIVFQDVVQTGGTSSITDSTSLILTFDDDPGLLTAYDITITGASKGVLTGSGRTRTLSISNITTTNGGTVTVSIANYSDYLISNSIQTAIVYRAPIEIIFQEVVQYGGSSASIVSVGLALTFDVDPGPLTVSDVTVEGATKGILTGSGNTRNLTISDITVFNGDTISISLANYSDYIISDSQLTAVVYQNIPKYGAQTTYSVDNVSFNLQFCPGGYSPTTQHDNIYVNTDPFWIGETEVTSELWGAVYDWATSSDRGENIYSFNTGSKGSEGGITANLQQPIVRIDWRDAVIFCNALTEWINSNGNIEEELSCVYWSEEKILRDRNNPLCDTADILESSTGFRLPIENEWENAARFIDGILWNHGMHTSGNLLGGALIECNNTDLEHDEGAIAYNNTIYCVYNKTSSSTVKSKLSNSLGVYDMNGNVREWTDIINSSNNRQIIGGHWEYTIVPRICPGGSVFSGTTNSWNNTGLRVYKNYH